MGLMSLFPHATLSLLLLLLHILPSLTQSDNKTVSGQTLPAILIFGDSIVDPGNNNHLKTLVKCNFPPYGLDYPQQVPTGRFGNGKIASDFIASSLGVKEYVPAYLGNELTTEDLLTGISFASGASGYDPLTPKIASVLSMNDQLDLFKDYMGKLNSVAGEARAQYIIKESLYVICSGTDDIANTYFGTPFRKAHYDIPSYVELLVTNAARFVEDLLAMGPRKIGFIGLPPIGCVPSQRTLGGGITRECEPQRNQAALLFNSRMGSTLKAIQQNHPDRKVVFLDIYDILLDLILNPTRSGFEESKRGCCGTGKLEVSVLCNKFTPVTCPDTSKFLFWDSYHPTEKGYEVLIDRAFQRYGDQLN